MSWHTPTSREGAVWGTGGPVVEPNGGLWVSNGNGAAGPGDPYDGSDSVTALSPVLHRNGFFAPASWAADNASDLDLGSTEPVIAAGDPTTALIVGKRGVGYLLSDRAPGRDRAPAGVAARSAGPLAAPRPAGPWSTSHARAAAWPPSTSARRKRKIDIRWRGPSDGNGSPVLGGGAAWVTAYDPDGGASGTLYELSSATGAIRSQIEIGAGLPHFSSLSLAGGTAYVGTLTGVTAVNGA